MSAPDTRARNEEPQGRTIVVTGMPSGYSVRVEGERVAVVRPDGGLSEWNGRPDTNGSGMYDLCLALAALPSVPAGPPVPRLTEEGPVGEAFLALWNPDSLHDEAVIFPDARLAKAAALRDLVGRVRSCFAPAVRPVAGEQGNVAGHQRLSAELTIAHAAEEEEALRLDLADTRRKLAGAVGIVSLASALVSHGDAAGFDASVFEDCSPGFRDDFHALRRAVAEPGPTSVAASPAALERRVEAMGDYVSHHGDWRRACKIARDAAGPSGHDHDDRGYWQHQIDTLDRVAAALRREGVSVVRHRSPAGESA